MTAREVRLKYVSEINRATLAEDTDPGLSFRYVDISAVTQGEVSVPDEPIEFGGAPSRARRLASPGDTLVSTVRTYLRAVAEVPDADDALVFSTGFAVVHPDGAVHPRFLTYQLQGEQFITAVEAISTGVSYPATTATEVGNLPVWLPSVPQQKAIADFLDRETAEIDAMIAKQEELVGLLGERRSAVIAHAVTKGLNPQAPMRDSGFEWLGEIPSHWTTMRLKFDLDFVTSGSRGWAEYYSDQGEPFIRISNLSRGSLDLRMDDVQLVEIPNNVEGSRTRLVPSDLLFSITAYLGSVALVPPEMEGAYVSQHVALARPSGNHVDPRYVGYFLLSEAGQRQLNEQAYGGTKMQLSLDDVRNLLVCVPPVEEQQRIADEVESDLSAMRRIIRVARESIVLMRERRAALISDAVTGRLDIDTYGRGRRPEEGVA